MPLPTPAVANGESARGDAGARPSCGAPHGAYTHLCAQDALVVSLQRLRRPQVKFLEFVLLRSELPHSKARAEGGCAWHAARRSRQYISAGGGEAVPAISRQSAAACAASSHEQRLPSDTARGGLRGGQVARAHRPFGSPRLLAGAAILAHLRVSPRIVIGVWVRNAGGRAHNKLDDVVIVDEIAGRS